MTTLLEDLADLTGVVGVPASAPASRDLPIAGSPPPELVVVLSGRVLRYALSLELLDGGELSVAALVERLEREGFRPAGRPSKTVSDALRWEMAHGRVVRVGRGRYRSGHIPRSTVGWLKQTLKRFVEASSSTAPTSAAPTSGAPDSIKLHPPPNAPIPLLRPAVAARPTARAILHRWRREQARRAGWTRLRQPDGPSSPTEPS